MLIRDAMESGAEGEVITFTVTLQDVHEIDTEGDFRVKRSLWSDLAFCSSPIAVKR